MCSSQTVAVQWLRWFETKYRRNCDFFFFSSGCIDDLGGTTKTNLKLGGGEMGSKHGY